MSGLEATDLVVTGAGRQLVSGVSLRVEPGQCVGVVGESGSGKSLTLRAVMGLLPSPLELTAGTVVVDGAERTDSSARQARAGLAMVFQDPAAALDPLIRVGAQLAAIRRHVRGRSAESARADVQELLERVRLPEPELLARRYPHELSGGQRQRIMIAYALASDPRYLLCDEPTTALDVTVQAEILDLLDRLRREDDLGILFVSHDLPVVARISERLAVMRRGVVVESGDTATLLANPQHSYTRELISAARVVAPRIRRVER